MRCDAMRAPARPRMSEWGECRGPVPSLDLLQPWPGSDNVCLIAHSGYARVSHRIGRASQWGKGPENDSRSSCIFDMVVCVCQIPSSFSRVAIGRLFGCCECDGALLCGYAAVHGNVWMWRCGCCWGSWADLMMQVRTLEAAITHHACEIYGGRCGVHIRMLDLSIDIFCGLMEILFLKNFWKSSEHQQIHLHPNYLSRLQSRCGLSVNA
jgi:hypothetical protein